MLTDTPEFMWCSTTYTGTQKPRSETLEWTHPCTRLYHRKLQCCSHALSPEVQAAHILRSRCSGLVFTTFEWGTTKSHPTAPSAQDYRWWQRVTNNRRRATKEKLSKNTRHQCAKRIGLQTSRSHASTARLATTVRAIRQNSQSRAARTAKGVSRVGTGDGRSLVDATVQRLAVGRSCPRLTCQGGGCTNPRRQAPQ